MSGDTEASEAKQLWQLPSRSGRRPPGERFRAGPSAGPLPIGSQHFGARM